MDSDDEILPEARVFDARIDSIWKQNLEVYNKALISEDEEDEKEDDKKGKCLKKDKDVSETEEEDRDYIFNSKAQELLKKMEARTKRKPRGNKRKTAAETEDSNEGIRLTASAKRRIREIELETAREAQRIEEENELVFAKCNNIRMDNIRRIDVEETLEETNREIFIKIKYLFKVSKVKATEKEEFKSIFQKVADLFGLKPTGFLLCLGDNNIKLSDTPESLNIRICDVIDCIPYDEEEENINNSHKLLLKIQSNDTRKKIEIRAHKLEKFLEVMKKYAEVRKLPLESLTFEFDGELIQPDETPLDLDMESGSCIDVRVSKVEQTSKQAPPKDAKHIPPIPMMDIVVID